MGIVRTILRWFQTGIQEGAAYFAFRIERDIWNLACPCGRLRLESTPPRGVVETMRTDLGSAKGLRASMIGHITAGGILLVLAPAAILVANLQEGTGLFQIASILGVVVCYLAAWLFASESRTLLVGRFPLRIDDNGIRFFPSLLAYSRKRQALIPKDNLSRIHVLRDDSGSIRAAIVLHGEKGRFVVGPGREGEMGEFYTAVISLWPDICIDGPYP